MEIRFRLNGKQVQAEVRPDTVLLDLVRELGCYSVKRGISAREIPVRISRYLQSALQIWATSGSYPSEPDRQRQR